MLLELWGWVAPIQIVKGKGISPGALLEEAAPLGGHETSSASDDSVRELP